MEVKFNIVQKIDHKGEVNKARYQPQNPNIIATMCTDGRVMIWDRSKHPSLPTGNVNPQLELLGHTAEGFGLSWSPHLAGHLATGSEDKTVRLWYVSPNLPLTFLPLTNASKGSHTIYQRKQSHKTKPNIYTPLFYRERCAIPSLALVPYRNRIR